MTEPQAGREGGFDAEMELLGGSNRQPGCAVRATEWCVTRA
jgi:hypothetical protein